MIHERLKELENAQEYDKMIDELRKHEAVTHWYSKLSSKMEETNSMISGILYSVEQLSLTITTLLRHCTSLIEHPTPPTPAETEASTLISIKGSISRDRDDIFSISTLGEILAELPLKESDASEKILFSFWIIVGGENKKIEITVSGAEYFAKALQEALSKIEEIKPNDAFSVSPLGYDALLLPQFRNSASQTHKSYGNEFTLIKLFI